MITSKAYYCPKCGNEETHSTNHYGEIYTRCRKCGGMGMYCKEASLGEPEKKAKMVFYRFNIEVEEEKKNYFELVEKLKGMGYKKFDPIVEWKEMEALKTHANEVIDLYNVAQFDNQIVSNVGRVFYWFEATYPNKRIKDGYYLEF